MSDGRIRVLVYIKGLGLGGAERMIVDSLPYIDSERFDYEFAYSVPWKDFLVKEISSAGHKVHLIPMSNPSQFPLLVCRLRQLLREGRFDLVHAHLPISGVAARAAGRLLGIPVLYTEHNLIERYGRLTGWLNINTYMWNAHVFAVSRSVRESISALVPAYSDVDTLTNGVPYEIVRQEASDIAGLRRELEIPDGHYVVGTVAVFREQKRLTDWIDAAVKVASVRDDVTFIIAGHGPEENIIREHIEASGIAKRFRMPGFRPDGRRMISLFDIFMMTSEYEGLPIAILEAMALGKTVVTTPVGGIPEAVNDGDDGVLCGVGDIEAMSSSVVRLLSDQENRIALGMNAAAKVRKDYHIKDRVKAVESAYLKVLGLGGEEGMF